jgi:hypothetical protein
LIELLITAQGVVRALYTESIPLSVLGLIRIERASYVEPDTSGQWSADLEPSQGPILGPFALRSEALQAEHDWLTQHVLLSSTDIIKKVENSTDDEKPPCKSEPITDTATRRAFQTAPCSLDLF